MNDQELIEKLKSYLAEVQEMLAFGDMGLLKSEELHNRKDRIGDELKALKDHFNKIESLKIEKVIPNYKMMPKTGMFLESHHVNPVLNPVHVLLQELIKAKSGSEQVEPVAVPVLKITGSTINKAIKDAKVLLTTEGATSALDRIHTVFHGYLKLVCNDAGISYAEDATLNDLMKLLKTNHPALVTKNDNADQVFKSMGNILDKLNPLRNNASLAHPNEVLLQPDEAMLVINTVNTLLAYLNSKFTASN